jgi:hypothetical protein
MPGEIAKWADPLCEGPLRAWPDDAARRLERAAWLSARYGQPEGSVLADLESQDIALASADHQDEVVLWFEHDLFDQAILVFLLARLAELAPERTSLICIGSFPGVTDFAGLGQLSPDQLATLFPARLPVTADRFTLAQQAWDALTGGDPEVIWTIATSGTPALPFLGEALLRYLAELPALRHGLGQTESLALQAIAAGADTPAYAFQAIQRFESRPWLGDSMFHAMLRLLATGPSPLLVPAAGPLLPVSDPAFGSAKLELTTEGRAVVTGRADWCRLAGACRWHGSILLEGPEPAWRWDERAERPVRR